jgi:hypothetical protein
MCLTYSEKLTNLYQKQLDKNGFIIAYKALRCADGKLHSFYRAYPYSTTVVQAYYYSKQSNKTLNIQMYKAPKYVERGIHVFLNKPNKFSYNYYTDVVLVPVKCLKEDFIAAGMFEKHRSAVFKKVTQIIDPEVMCLLAKNKQKIKFKIGKREYVFG